MWKWQYAAPVFVGLQLLIIPHVNLFIFLLFIKYVVYKMAPLHSITSWNYLFCQSNTSTLKEIQPIIATEKEKS